MERPSEDSDFRAILELDPNNSFALKLVAEAMQARINRLRVGREQLPDA